MRHAGLTTEEIRQLTERIREAGSLAVVIRELQKKKYELKSEVSELTEVKQHSTSECDRLAHIIADRNKSLRENENIRNKLESALSSLREEYTEVVEQMLQRRHDIYITSLIIDFLSDRKRLNDFDLDQFLGMMIAVRQVRRGEKLTRKTDAKGNFVFQCILPGIMGAVPMSQGDISRARELLASYLAPLVRNQFVTRAQYDAGVCRTVIDTFRRVQGLG